MVDYTAVRKKRTVVEREIHSTVALSQLKEEPDTHYEDVSDLPSPGNVDLQENAAYAHVQH